jgi:hypothetical protein
MSVAPPVPARGAGGAAVTCIRELDAEAQCRYWRTNRARGGDTDGCGEEAVG